jgi:hypothetical protein
MLLAYTRLQSTVHAMFEWPWNRPVRPAQHLWRLLSHGTQDALESGRCVSSENVRCTLDGDIRSR